MSKRKRGGEEEREKRLFDDDFKKMIRGMYAILSIVISSRDILPTGIGLLTSLAELNDPLFPGNTVVEHVARNLKIGVRNLPLTPKERDRCCDQTRIF